jgi:thiol-disulfide isomerase/thioredoxin
VPVERPGPGRTLAVGAVVPALEATTLAGQKLQIPQDYRGKLLLLDFWATWCGPCRAEIPRLVELYEQFQSRGLAVAGVSLDAAQDVSRSRVADFVQEQKMSWEQVYDREDAAALAAAFGVSALPEAFLIDGTSGKILACGSELRGANLRRTIERHLPVK